MHTHVWGQTKATQTIKWNVFIYKQWDKNGTRSTSFHRVSRVHNDKYREKDEEMRT